MAELKEERMTSVLETGVLVKKFALYREPENNPNGNSWLE
jgi:hypothetical protein